MEVFGWHWHRASHQQRACVLHQWSDTQHQRGTRCSQAISQFDARHGLDPLRHTHVGFHRPVYSFSSARVWHRSNHFLYRANHIGRRGGVDSGEWRQPCPVLVAYREYQHPGYILRPISPPIYSFFGPVAVRRGNSPPPPFPLTPLSSFLSFILTSPCKIVVLCDYKVPVFINTTNS